jgi:alkylhydroperoxidase family enzyme
MSDSLTGEVRVAVAVTITTEAGAYTTHEHLGAVDGATREQIVENGVGIARKALWDAVEAIMQDRKSKPR